MTVQTRALPPGALTDDPAISVEENRFLLTGFQPWGGGWCKGTPAQSPHFPPDPEPPLLPKRLRAKTTPRSSPYPYLTLSQSREQVSTPSGTCACGFQSPHPLAAAPSFRICGALFSASTWWFRKTHAVVHGIMVESREAHGPRERLLHVSFREAEVPPLSLQTTRRLPSSFSARPHFNAWPGTSCVTSYLVAPMMC